MATYRIFTPFGPAVVTVKVTRIVHDWMRSLHYDREWMRTVQVIQDSSAPFTVNRTQLRFSLQYRVRPQAQAKHPTPANDPNKYKVTREYTDGYIDKAGSGDAPKGAKDKLDQWMNEFIPQWLEANAGVVWVVAEREGKIEDSLRIDKDVEALHRRINALNEEANILLSEAEELKKQEGPRLVSVGDVKVEVAL